VLCPSLGLDDERERQLLMKFSVNGVRHALDLSLRVLWTIPVLAVVSLTPFAASAYLTSGGVGRVYDAANRLTNTISPRGAQWTRSFNSRGLISEAKEPSSDLAPGWRI
jgi:YD repeat-containing protein